MDAEFPVRKKKLLVLASTYPILPDSHEPGFVFELCQHLSQNYAVTVLTQSRLNAATRSMDGNVEIIRYRYAPKGLELLSENGGIAGSLKSSPWLITMVPFMLCSQIFHLVYHLRKRRPEIIHAHWIFPQAFCISLAQILAVTRIPVVCTSHGGDLYGLEGKLFHHIKSWTLKRIQSFSVVSNAMKLHVENTFPEFQSPVHVFPMGVDLKGKFTGKIDTRNYKQHSLLFVGRIVKKKGLLHLVHCLKHLLDSNPDYSLTIAGEGPERAEIEAEVHRLGIQHAVHFLGGVESGRLPELYRSSHLAVFPFIQAEDGDMEGLGLVMIEAMGCHCPVIAGNVPAVHDVIHDGETGFLGDPLDTIVFSKIIERAATDHKLVQMVSNNAYHFVHKKYAWEICAERYHQLFKQI